MNQTQVILHCQICKSDIVLTNRINLWDGRVCCQECHSELKWRQHLAMMGKPYKERQAKLVEEKNAKG